MAEKALFNGYSNILSKTNANKAPGGYRAPITNEACRNVCTHQLVPFGAVLHGVFSGAR
jgi:hypothetical protein